MAQANVFVLVINNHARSLIVAVAEAAAAVVVVALEKKHLEMVKELLERELL
jgi:hypothetical protein